MKLPFVIRHSSFVIACNEDVQAANDSVSAGVFSVLDGGALFVPFGAYPQNVLLHPDDARKARALGHRVGTNGSAVATQLVDAQAANDMAADLTGLIARAMRGFKHIAVYNGHPYHPDAEKAKAYSDRRAYGWVKEISAANDGVRLDVDYTTLGTQAVNEGWFAFHSPQWDMRIVRIDADGIFCRPYRLRSGGLTNEPNIPVPPIVAANESGSETENREQRTENPNPMKPETLLKLKKLLGLADDTDDTAFDQAANEYCDKLATEKKEDEKEAIASANEAVTQARAAALASREARVDMGLDQLVTAGRITVAERPALRTDLIACANEADVTAGLEKLKAAKPKLQTQLTHSDNIAKEKGKVIAANDGDARRVLRDQAVESVRKEKPGISDTVAWGIAAGRNPALFAA